MKKAKRIFFMVMIVGMIFSLAAVYAGGGQETQGASGTEAEETVKKEPVNIILFADVLVPQMERMFDRFTADSGYPVELEPLPGGQDFFNIVPARLASGEGPDILIAHGTPLEYILYNPEGNFIDLTSYVQSNVAGKKVPQAIVDANKVNGKSYGIPFGPITLRGYYYNKNVQKDAGIELPKSAKDFIQNAAPKIKAAGYDPLYSMGQDRWGEGMEAENYVGDEFTQTDIQERINANKASFADSAFLRAFQWQKDLYDKGFYNSDVLVGTYDGAVEAMVQGTAFATMLSVNTMGRFPDEANADYLGGLYLSENSNRAYYSLPHYAYLVKEESGGDNKDGAMAFFEWFMVEDHLFQYYSDLRTTSAFIGIDNEMWPYAKDLKKGFDNSDPPFTYTLKASTKQAGTYSAQVVAGTKTPLEATQEMQRDFAASAKAVGLEGYK